LGTDRSFADFSRRENYDVSQNIIVNYTGTHYVRVLKRFEAFADYPGDSPEAKLVTPEYTRRFHLRYYIPKATLLSKEERVKQIVIMFNGLNEVDRFDLYDVLGEHLAEQGIAAVLLPTPYHLNRSAPIRRGAKTARQPPHVALFKNPLLMYYNYMQSIRESNLLIRKLRQKTIDESDLGFYKSLFDPKLKISILGFSLGGLRALASFVHEPRQYHTCIVFNSGVALSMLNTELIRISKEAWNEFVTRLHDAAKRHSTKIPARQRAYWDTFNMVFLGTDPFELRNKLKQHSEKLFLILSGADSTVPPDISALEVEGHGLNVFRIAGVGHIPTVDPKWSFWIDRVSELIVGFVGQAGRQLWSRQGIVSALAAALGSSERAVSLLQADDEESTSPQLGDFLKNIERNQRDEATEAYYASMAFYPRFRDVLREVAKSFETK